MPSDVRRDFGSVHCVFLHVLLLRINSQCHRSWDTFEEIKKQIPGAHNVKCLRRWKLNIMECCIVFHIIYCVRTSTTLDCIYMHNMYTSALHLTCGGGAQLTPTQTLIDLLLLSYGRTCVRVFVCALRTASRTQRNLWTSDKGALPRRRYSRA